MKFQNSALTRLPKKSFNDLPEAIGVYVSEKSLKSPNWARCLPSILKIRATTSVERLHEPLKAGGQLKVPAYEKGVPDVHIFVLPEDLSAFSLLGFARSSVKALVSSHMKSVALAFVESKDELAESLGAALSVRAFSMPIYGKKKKEHKAFKLSEVQIYSGKNISKAFEYGFESGNGTNLARFLGTLPANELPPGVYGKKIQELARKTRLTCKFYSKTQLKKMGAGAFTAVDQGNPESKGGIYELTYNPKKAKNKKTLTLVGKGLCYDTGGYDVKTQGYMLGMKADMLGSAVALSTIVTAAKLKLPVKMKAFLGVTENHISPKAYKADDVVTAMNGTSIEVINTDAEGRMVLADTLCLASKGKPGMIVDFATLTGCATIAIGTSYSAGFTNNEALHSRIVKSGRKSGERVWTFPMDKDFEKALKSDVADTIQCIKARGPDHILAAIFLSKFVEKGIDWVHIDLSSADKEGGLGHVDSTITGFGVRWALAFIRDQYKC